MEERRRRKFVDIPFQRKLLIFIFVSAMIPAVIVAICLYYLIFNLLAQQMVIPEAIAYNLIPVARKVTVIIFISLPVTLLIIWIIAVEMSHKIAGPLFRLERELDRRISGEDSSYITVRKKDELKSLVEKINQLLDKIKKGR
ncbi:MAG: methyl-accepting chemotaxis protein [Candidatus Omnitrophota bacterium]|nr:MAG: methyl-accepting chemotaxis protein [Candidatus Omnitrophota bacterium]